jgi:hypothetical protein
VTVTTYDRLGEAIRRLDTPVVPFLVAVLLANLFGIAILRRNGNDQSRLVVAGDRFADPSAVPAGLFVFPNSHGYDGQFFYRLALDPFTSTRTDFGVTLDNPAYRQRRILVPALAWLASFGDSSRVPSALLILNLVALALAGWAGGAYARSLGRHALWGLAFALYPGFLLSTARDLAEVVAVVLALAAFLALRARRFALATAALTLASFARETTLLFALGVAIVGVLESATRAKRTVPLFVWIVPIGLQGAWQAALSVVWGSLSADPHNTLTPIPLAGPVALIASIVERWDWIRGVWLVEIALLALTAALALACLRSSVASHVEKAALVLAVLLSAFLSSNIWVEDWGFMRALSEFYALAAIVVLGGGPGARATLAAGASIVYALLFFDLTLGWH